MVFRFMREQTRVQRAQGAVQGAEQGTHSVFHVSLGDFSRAGVCIALQGLHEWQACFRSRFCQRDPPLANSRSHGPLMDDNAALEAALARADALTEQLV